MGKLEIPLFHLSEQVWLRLTGVVLFVIVTEYGFCTVLWNTLPLVKVAFSHRHWWSLGFVVAAVAVPAIYHRIQHCLPVRRAHPYHQNHIDAWIRDVSKTNVTIGQLAIRPAMMHLVLLPASNCFRTIDCCDGCAISQTTNAVWPCWASTAIGCCAHWSTLCSVHSFHLHHRMIDHVLNFFPSTNSPPS